MESELAVTTMIPDGDYRMFSATDRCNAWTAGVEYDRHSWGHLLKSQVDYVVEVIPIMILSQPAVSDFWGNAKSTNQELVPGVSITPFGFRFLWRHIGNSALPDGQVRGRSLCQEGVLAKGELYQFQRSG